ncbi:MAG: DUF1049 domain-containing protein [Alphaproteobacteria bacterium]|nr:DUF1049 domain-containing protein [Alphaproteobacteria bacterium]
MRHLRWIVTVPLTAIVIVFAVNNRDAVMLDLWPFDIAIAAPAFLLVLGSAALCFVAGVSVAWLTAFGRQREARRRDRRINTLEREIGRLQTTTQGASPTMQAGTARLSPPAGTPMAG